MGVRLGFLRSFIVLESRVGVVVFIYLFIYLFIFVVYSPYYSYMGGCEEDQLTWRESFYKSLSHMNSFLSFQLSKLGMLRFFTPSEVDFIYFF